MTPQPRIIDGAKLLQIRGDGAQLYAWGDGASEQLWVPPSNRATNVRIGMTGRLFYRNTGRRGLYCFLPYGSSLMDAGTGSGRGPH